MAPAASVAQSPAAHDPRKKGPLVIQYRPFRNDDPPGLLKVWNAAFTGRGTVPLRTPTALEHFVFAKLWFDPAGLIVAADGPQIVGFAHAGFGPAEGGRGVSTAAGVACALGVLPSHRGRGVGTELLRRSEAYLTGHGAKELYAGPMPPLNPFYFGLYGGSNQPGFLASDAAAGPFLTKRGYRPAESRLVLHRQLSGGVSVADARFPALRRRFDARVLARHGTFSWWEEDVLGPVELLEFALEERSSGRAVARALVWEMEGFAQRWGQAAVGLYRLEVEPEWRRQGLARYLLAQAFLYLQDQFYAVVEAQVSPDDEAALRLFQGLGFTQVDVGHRYRRAM